MPNHRGVRARARCCTARPAPIIPDGKKLSPALERLGGRVGARADHFWRARGPCEAFSRRDRARRRPLVLSRAPARPPSRAARPLAARPRSRRESPLGK